MGPAPFSIGDAVNYGWTTYWKNVGPMLLITLAIFAVQLVINLFGQVVRSVPALILFEIVSFVVGMIVALGLIRATLELTAGRVPVVADVFKTEGIGNYVVAAIIFGLGFAIGLVLCIIPGIIFALVFGFFGFVICESGGGMQPMDALKRSAELTRGHRGELFGLFVVLLLINIVGFIACLVGAIFTYGITAIAVAYTYKSLTGQQVARWG